MASLLSVSISVRMKVFNALLLGTLRFNIHVATSLFAAVDHSYDP